jgi:hypothetical protein
MRRFAGLLAALALVAAACSPTAGPPRTDPGSVSPHLGSPVTTTSNIPAIAPVTAPLMVEVAGPVEALFVHPLVLDPELAFTGDRLGLGFRDYFITDREFAALLDELWRNGWTLVDAHAAASGRVRVPEGRKPLVLMEDDANYYAYFDGRGLAKRLVLDDTGSVRAQLADGSLTDRDVVPMVEAAVARHPEFSADGAKGVLALTAYEGFLGEHDLTAPGARHRLRALASRLRETGWTFASHSWGHINLTTAGQGWILQDAARWRGAATGLLGPVDMLVYPFGAPPSPDMRELLGREGFPIQWDIGVTPSRQELGAVTLLSRRHVDGFAFEVPERQKPFYDVATVRDPQRPG